MKIRESIESDKKSIASIHTQAFGKEKGPVIARLVMDLFQDKTALPRLSLVAEKDGKLAGHILFTKVTLEGEPDPVSAQILAPLAVLPCAQTMGIGQQLIRSGLLRLAKAGVELVFVLGHPGYYPRTGFTPAGKLGFEAPYPIPEEVSGAWMVQELCPGVIGRVKGRVHCSKVLDQPQHWQE